MLSFEFHSILYAPDYEAGSQLHDIGSMVVNGQPMPHAVPILVPKKKSNSTDIRLILLKNGFFWFGFPTPLSILSKLPSSYSFSHISSFTQLYSLYYPISSYSPLWSYSPHTPSYSSSPLLILYSLSSSILLPLPYLLLSSSPSRICLFIDQYLGSFHFYGFMQACKLKHSGSSSGVAAAQLDIVMASIQ